MASAAVQGFITGFAGTMSENIADRKKRARDFFEKQVEYARTTGLENRRRVKETVDTSLSIARQLEQVGVPKEVIMAQINQNPQGLGDFYTQAEKIRASAGRDFSPEEWKAIYKVAGDFKAPDEDLSTFISRTYDPIANAASSPDFEDDPEGSLWASMMGYNAMDKARAELARTEIAEGLTADELIRYGDVTPQRVGGQAVVTTNYSELGQETDPLTISETSQLRKVVEDEAKLLLDEAALPEGADATQIRDQIVDRVYEIYPRAGRAEIERMATSIVRLARHTVDMPSTEAEEAPTEPVAPAEGADTQETETPSVEAPTSSAEPLTPEERMAAESGLGYTNIKDKGNGLVEVTLPSGQVRTYRASDVREVLKVQLGYRP